ncbi:hypothetical protein DM02DRAFT_407823 [Periconia macrospinosa]|uniref:Uncharacterized protein n=1 Tax=Periconia macrospinosa TaxID=97972 RepID=A0A2V1E8R0_9PLEO|nr:hypothetical protein DM02DRAFT_407823 [Periconia macrospinosa]
MAVRIAATFAATYNLALSHFKCRNSAASSTPSLYRRAVSQSVGPVTARLKLWSPRPRVLNCNGRRGFKHWDLGSCRC